jgi:uncharacterized protein with beta-barrel porin domain
VQVRSVIPEIQVGASEIGAPVLQAAVDAPRVQIGLIGERMQRMRNESGHGFSNQVQVNVAGMNVGGGEKSEGSDEDAEGADKQADARWGVFMLGSVDIGTRSGGEKAGGYDVRTRGLTAGVDYRFSKAITAGVAVGGLRGGSDSRIVSQDNRGYSASVFGQWLPSDRWYFAGVFNRGRNTYDIERTGQRGPTAGSAFKLNSKGKSMQSALQLEAGYSFASGNSKFTPFVRYERIRASIGKIKESGGPNALEIDGYSASLGTFSGGLQADWVFNTRSGVLIPGAKVEFVSERESSDQVFARLASNVSGFLPLNDTPVDQTYGNAGVSLQWLTGVKGQPLSVFFAFDYLFGRDQFTGRTLSLGVKVPL